MPLGLENFFLLGCSWAETSLTRHQPCLTVTLSSTLEKLIGVNRLGCAVLISVISSLIS